MSKVSLADTIDEGESLLGALDGEGLVQLPHLREMRDEMASILDAIKELAAEQVELQARRQAITQQLRITRSKWQDLVIKVRSAIRGELGHRSEFLVRYRIRPVRRRSRAKDEEVGVAVFPRPDLLPAAGLASGPAPVPDPPAGETHERDGAGSEAV